VLVAMRPTSQSLQMPWPTSFWNLPGMHDMHDEAPLDFWALPISQSVHAEDVFASGVYFPISQSLHKAWDSRTWCLPGMQGKQNAEPFWCCW
jgi:hypothetical protein